MKYLVLIVQTFLIIVLCNSCVGHESNETNELEKSLYNLAEATADAWTDFRKISSSEDNENNNFTETGRGRKSSKMMIPLMFGFKMAGIVISALTALKILLVQSLFLSKFALAGALILGVKVLSDHMHGHLYKVTDISHVNSYGHSSLPSHLGLDTSHYETVLDPANLGYAYYTPTEETAGDDLQGHFSSGIPVLHAVQAKNFSASDRFYSAAIKRPNKKVVAVKTIIRKRTDIE